MKQRRQLQPARAVRVAPAVLASAVVSALIVIALVATGGRIVPVQSIGAPAPEVYSATESFASGANMDVPDAAIRTQGGEDVEVRRVVKEFTREREFSMIGLTSVSYTHLTLPTNREV